MAHTPGPWKVNHLPWCIYVGHGVEDSVTGHSAESIAYNVTGDANARLIAAAPDLLEALRPFAYLAEVMEEGQILNFRGVYVTWEQVTAAAAAIAKARGNG